MEELMALMKKSDKYEVITGSWSGLVDGDVVTVTSAEGKSPIMIMVEPASTKAYPATWDVRRPTESLNRTYTIPVNDSGATIYAAANIIEITETSISVKFYNNNFVQGITYLYFAVFE